MKAVIQRVIGAEVLINHSTTRKIKQGLLVLVGFCNEDTQEDIEWMAQKLIKMRIFADENQKMNYSIEDIKGEVLIISQFTLYASTKKGNRPSYLLAAQPDIAIPMYNKFVEQIKLFSQLNIVTGEFGANMQINLINDGPVTIVIDTKNKE